MAATVGFEPTNSESKSEMLPLHHIAMYWCSCQFNLRQSKINYMCALRDINWVKQISII